MKKRHTAQYTIRNISSELDDKLRIKARKAGKSLNQLTLDILQDSVSEGNEEKLNHSLDKYSGSWVDDPKFDKAIAEQRRIDPEDWT